MRTTVTFDDDTAALVEQQRRRDGIGVSEAVNRLIRQGVARPTERRPYVHRSAAIGLKVDVTDIGAVLDMLDDD
ncbi:MAG: ribbon-helix-helix protein, CopG family [Acidimicrobiales bacterium]